MFVKSTQKCRRLSHRMDLHSVLFHELRRNNTHSIDVAMTKYAIFATYGVNTEFNLMKHLRFYGIGSVFVYIHIYMLYLPHINVITTASIACKHLQTFSTPIFIFTPNEVVDAHMWNWYIISAELSWRILADGRCNNIIWAIFFSFWDLRSMWEPLDKWLDADKSRF